MNMYYLFAKDDKLSIFFLGQSSHDFGHLQGSKVIIIFARYFHMNTTVCSHGKGSADGLLSKIERWVKRKYWIKSITVYHNVQ